MGCGGGTLKGVAGVNELSTVLPDDSRNSEDRSSLSSNKSSRKKSSRISPDTTPNSPDLKNPARSEKQTKRVVAHRRSETAPRKQSHISNQAHRATRPEDRKFLNKVLQKHYLFCWLGEEQRGIMIDHMEKIEIDEDTVVFEQSDKGDMFYIIMNGTFLVSIDKRPLKTLRPKNTFGELAILYNVSRTATISCVESGILWTLGEKRFREAQRSLQDQQRSKVSSFLEVAPGFCKLMPADRASIGEAVSVQVFRPGDQILREGEVGDWMFVIMEGNVQIADLQSSAMCRQPGTVIGALGIMCTKRQIFSAKAIDAVTCLALGRSSISELSSTIQNFLKKCALRMLLLGGATSREGELDFFGQLFEPQLDQLLDRFEEVSFQQGNIISKSGSEPQVLIVVEGEVAVVTDETLAQINDATYIKEFAKDILRPGMSYGGSSVLDASELKDTVVALGDVRIRRFTNATLTEVIGGSVSDVLQWNEIKKVISEVFLFKSLDEDQIDSVVRAFKKRRYATGEVVVNQGDDAKHFFLIQSGTVKVLKDGVLLRTLARWDYFGERGLLLQERRSATVEAETACVCLMLEAKTFTDIVGMFRRDIEHRMYLQDLDITIKDLSTRAVVGRGTFGVVRLVCHCKDTSKMYALKCVSKQHVVDQHQEKAVTAERAIHEQCYHPCVVQFIKTFKDRRYIYFLTEFLGGGDLFYVIREIGALAKQQAQFFAGSIVLALGYLHGRGIMYRDLKPENVLLDFEGNAKIVDFGCCKKALRAATLAGTPEYLAPEVILGKGYTAAVDWWALGVMMHEFVIGPLPFGKESNDQLELFRDILESDVVFPEWIDDISAVAVICGLLDRTPELRMGSGGKGSKEIQEHAYFEKMDWKALLGHYMPAPWTPDINKIRSTWEAESEDGFDPEADENDDPNLDEPEMEWSLIF